jgi:predicted permease
VAFLGGPDGSVYLSMDADWRVLAFTSGLGVGTCLLFGLGPALRATRVTPASVMHGGRGASGLADRHLLRRGLVVSQIALSFVLVAGALLFGRSLRNLQTTDMGMATAGVLAATVSTDADEGRRPLLFGEIEERVRRLPDVAAAATVQYYPFGGSEWNEDVYVGPSSTATTLAWLNRVSPRYFETMETPFIAGRDFTSEDRRGTPNVAIVNQAFARGFFGDTDPIGQRFRYRGVVDSQDPVFTIVGLVANTTYSALRERPRPIAFLPVAQDAPLPDRLTVVVRARGAMGAVFTGVEREVAAVDPRLLVEFRVLDTQIAQSLLRERLVANLSGGFGLLAAVLATLGLYGVMSYIIARRRAEIGVRMALGARRLDILAQVLRESGRLVAGGLVLGLVVALLSLRSAESLLFGLAPTDARSFVLAAALLGTTAFIAALVPALRAATTDVAVILRGD